MPLPLGPCCRKEVAWTQGISYPSWFNYSFQGLSLSFSEILGIWGLDYRCYPPALAPLLEQTETGNSEGPK